MNDDEAEKRRRRKSMKSMALITDDGDAPQAGPSNHAQADGGGTPVAPAGRSLQRLRSVAQVPAINVSIDVNNYEEWMKMATDNKINAANSWNFALIDYFHDMSLLRNTGDNSINFQRASCTLDGCVKIWTSRVDSVGTETGKLLSNLANEGRADDDEDADSDNPDATPGAKRKRREGRPKETLAKSTEQLRSKKLDLEFKVDPLFRKTCADFDEGGAQGLLMNHLSLGIGPDAGMRIIFDASDAMGKGTEEDAEPTEEPEEEVDISHLRREFLPDLDGLQDKAICHSLAGFSFAKDAFTFDESLFVGDDIQELDDDDDFGGVETGAGESMDVGGGADAGGMEEDFFVGDQAVGDEYGAGPDFGPGGDDFGGGEDGSVGPEGEQQGQGHGGGRPGAFVPFDPRRMPNEREIVMAMTEGGEDGMLDYFDQNFLRNWAGPEHWKLRKVVRRPEAADTSKDKPKREKKEAFRIDFLAPADKSLKETAEALFAPATRGNINLPGYSVSGKNAEKSKKRGRGKKAAADGKEKRDDHTLPDDMHFSSRELVTLFLKPKFSLKMRGQRVRLDEGDGEIDENFWAQAAANAGREGDEGDETANGGAIPFNTQFFHDDYDDGPGFDDGFDGEGGSAANLGPDADEQDLLAATAGQTRRVRPEFVNYAKRAKRVDVRKLKENIWKGLDIVVPEIKQEAEDEDQDMDKEEQDATDPAEARTFSEVVTGLKSSYPKDKMEEISTSFCFICLLHLANERGLKLEVGEDGQIEAEPEEEEEEPEAAEHKVASKVGDIWDLKVYRDPLATAAA
ncbi:barren [Punctularia strigosozonata HHB-11173 SS5]|uniref:barren n=1 Tax=Punctularia strigosozonata (strain HHB-11173) TaxID=741275 RepID=UPI0004418141|nr:barren [Punctularia strigosozonata HHB-11173 SS5]EIN06142.1 barren [Punctularia strigosozonata HHB-11173 SS5]